jgi:hypothetical protein
MARTLGCNRQRCVTAALSLSILPIGPRCYAEPHATSARRGQDLGCYRLSVNVHLVALPVAVRDSEGRDVPDLRGRDHEVYEDRLPPKLSQVTAADRTFVHFSNPEDRLFVVNFNAAGNGAYRTVRVAARVPDHGKLIVRTRAGYIAGGQPPLEQGEDSK